MPIDRKDFKPTGVAGCRWNRRNRTALFDVVTRDGKRVRRIFDYDSVEDAKAAFPAFKAAVKAGEGDPAPRSSPRIGHADPIHASPASLASYVDEQWTSLHARCGASTVKTNRNVYKNYVETFFGEMSLAAIGEAECEDFAAKMKADGRSPYTTNLALRFVRKVLHHARRRKLRQDVPENFHFAKEYLLKLELSDTEQQRFLNAFDDEAAFVAYLKKKQRRGKVVRSARFGFKDRSFGGSRKPDSDAAKIHFKRFQRSKLIFTAAIDLGLRESDLRLLKRSSVDLTRNVVAITTQKTGKPAVVALSDRCRAVIVEATSHPVVSTEYVFTTEEGRPYSESTLRRYFAIAKKFAGITRRCRLNDLRHSFASNLASEGLSLLDIRDALGHTTVRMSERYAKPNEHALERMRDALNRSQKRVSGDTRSDTRPQDSGQ